MFNIFEEVLKSLEEVLINVPHPFLSFSGTDFVHSIVHSICCHLQVIGISTSSRANSRKHSHLSTAAVVS